MALITICNLIAILWLYPKVDFLVRDYMAQRKAGQSPVFNRAKMPDDAADLEAWDD